MSEKSTRRSFLQQTSLLLGAATGVPYFFSADRCRAEPGRSPHDRPIVGCIGNGGMGGGDARAISKFGDIEVANRLGRKIRWDPQTQQILGDAEAASFLSRKQRKGYEIEG